MTDNKNNDFEFAQNPEVEDHYSGKSYSYGQLIWHRFLRNKGAVVSVVVLVIITLIAFLAPHFSQFSPTYAIPVFFPLFTFFFPFFFFLIFRAIRNGIL